MGSIGKVGDAICFLIKGHYFMGYCMYILYGEE